MNGNLHPLKKKSGRYKAWVEQASFDLEAAKLSFSKGFYEWATFQSVQAVEKALKSVIVQAGWRPPKLHRLSVLIGIANQLNTSFERTKFNFHDLESFTFISRYPFALPGKEGTPHEIITQADAKIAFDQAVEIVNKINDLLETGLEQKRTLVSKLEFKMSEDEINDRLERVISELKREFDPEKIVLFGSFAAADASKKTELNTIDLLIVAESNLSFFERIKKVHEITKGGIPTIEPLVYTPEEFKYLMEEEGEGLLEEAIEKGKVLYEKTVETK